MNTNRNIAIWLVMVITVAGILGAGYFVFRARITSGISVGEKVAGTPEPLGQPETKKETTAKGTVVTVSDSKFGSILFDGNGQAIYIWELEDSTKAECYGDCAEAWPPVLTNGAPIASNGVNNELLGTTKRTDGTTQVTYNGHPLYYYAHEKAGEVKCHNVSTHGGLWWVIQPSGTRAK